MRRQPEHHDHDDAASVHDHGGNDINYHDDGSIYLDNDNCPCGHFDDFGTDEHHAESHVDDRAWDILRAAILDLVDVDGGLSIIDHNPIYVRAVYDAAAHILGRSDNDRSERPVDGSLVEFVRALAEHYAARTRSAHDAASDAARRYLNTPRDR